MISRVIELLKNMNYWNQVKDKFSRKFLKTTWNVLDGILPEKILVCTNRKRKVKNVIFRFDENYNPMCLKIFLEDGLYVFYPSGWKDDKRPENSDFWEETANSFFEQEFPQVPMQYGKWLKKSENQQKLCEEENE